LVDRPPLDLSRRQSGRANRQQAFDSCGAEIWVRSIGALTSRRYLGTNRLEQRSQWSRIAAVVDDGQLGGDQCREEQDAEEA
jgi:hypothetical protein